MPGETNEQIPLQATSLLDLPEGGGYPKPETPGDPGQAPGEGKPPKGMERFWNAEAGSLDVEKLSTSYTELEKKFHSTRPPLTAEGEVKYTPNVAADLAGEGVELSADDPLWKAASQVFAELRLPQDSVDKIVDTFLRSEMAGTVVDATKEMQALGPDGPALVGAIKRFQSTASPEVAGWLNRAVKTADDVRAVAGLLQNRVFGRKQDPEEVSTEPGANAREQYQQMLQDPRYAAGDPAYIRELEAFAKKAWPGQTRVG